MNRGNSIYLLSNLFALFSCFIPLARISSMMLDRSGEWTSLPCYRFQGRSIQFFEDTLCHVEEVPFCSSFAESFYHESVFNFVVFLLHPLIRLWGFFFLSFFRLVIQYIGIPVVAQQAKNRLVSVRMQILFLTSISGLRLWCCCKLHRWQMQLRSDVAWGCSVG